MPHLETYLRNKVPAFEDFQSHCHPGSTASQLYDCLQLTFPCLLLASCLLLLPNPNSTGISPAASLFISLLTLLTLAL